MPLLTNGMEGGVSFSVPTTHPTLTTLDTPCRKLSPLMLSNAPYIRLLLHENVRLVSSQCHFWEFVASVGAQFFRLV